MMLNKITHNLPAKIICLLLAFSLWTYVVSGEAKVDSYPGKIPLEVNNKSENLVVVKSVNDVEIKIIADRGVWKKLSSNSFSAYIDLTGLSQGTHEVPVHTKSNVENVQIIEIKPTRIMVSLEPVVTKSVKIKSKIEGAAKEGMMATEVNLEPTKVDVSGPESIISRITDVYALVVLNGEEGNFNKSVPIKAYDDQGKEYDNITFNPREVQAEVLIAKAAQAKTVGVKVNLEGRLASGYWINQIITNPQIITISGQSANLAGTDYIETKAVSIDGLNSNKTQQIGLNIPDGITLEDKVSKVTVELSILSIDSSKELTIGYNYTNLAEKLKINSLDSTGIKLVLSGASDKLTNLDTSGVKVNIDLSGYTQAGTYAIDIKDTMITKPDSLSIVSFMPSSIRITLDTK
ncbi:MAG: YbbR family protein [uncultured bacterium]|nr:MAG: YbbR family protein [uncultured bacterium]